MGNKQSKDSIVTVSEELKEGVSKYVDVVLKLGEKEIERLEAAAAGGPTSQPLAQPSGPDENANSEEIELRKYGLGRGVDATNPRPWVNKTALQVRKVDDSFLIRTNEGESVHAFYEEVTSISDQKAKLNLSIAVPTSPVTVSVGADISRTLTETRKSFGKCLLSETIAFKPTFDDTERALAQEVLDLFCESGEEEERTLDGPGSQATPRPVQTLIKYLEEDEKKKEDERKCYLLAFLNRYRITHYVSSITLGASKYMVLSDYKYLRTITTTADTKFDIESVGSVTLPSGVFKKDLKKYSRDIQYIGRFKNEGSVEETEDSYKNMKYELEKKAVVSVKLEPISSLIKEEKFRKFMTEALETFIKQQNSRKEGPFIISCKDAKICLKVRVDERTDHAQVYATDKAEEASHFYIFRTEDGDHPYEFYIAWQRKTPDEKDSDKKASREETPVEKHKASQEKIQGTMRYLTSASRVLGRHNGPLCLESRAKKHHSLFSINRRLTDPFFRISGDKNVNPEPWFRGEESFLIRCTGRRGIDGFVAVKRTTAGDDPYKTVSRPHPRGCDDGTFHMAFRLHSVADLKKLPNYKSQAQRKTEPGESGGASHRLSELDRESNV